MKRSAFFLFGFIFAAALAGCSPFAPSVSQVANAVGVRPDQIYDMSCVSEGSVYICSFGYNSPYRILKFRLAKRSDGTWDAAPTS